MIIIMEDNLYHNINESLSSLGVKIWNLKSNLLINYEITLLEKYIK